MRSLILLAALVAWSSLGEVYAGPGECGWHVTAAIPAPSKDQARDSGTTMFSSWTWSFDYVVTHKSIQGSMAVRVEFANTSLAKTASSVGTYTVVRVVSCPSPVEDIEETGHNGFSIECALDDDNHARGFGRLRAKSSKTPMDVHSHGGLECTSSPRGDGSSGSYNVSLGGISSTVNWSTASDAAKSFHSISSGTGGKSPETLTCYASLDMAVSCGWAKDTGRVGIKTSAYNVRVLGTCDGACKVSRLALTLGR